MGSRLNRRDFLKISSASAVSAALAGCVGRRVSNQAGSDVSLKSSRDRKPPNILILFTDDQRFNAVGALGDPAVKTPNIDRLVGRGVSFTDTYIMGARHGAVCMPSRAMLLTGRHYFNLPDSVTVTWNVKPGQRGDCPHVTFPEHFRDAGYDTFGTGKWHNGRKLFAKGFTHGGNIFFGGMHDHLKTPVHDFDPTGEYPGKAKRAGAKFSSELFSDSAIEFLDNRSDDKPFLMYVSYTAPHDPRMAPKEYAEMYPPGKIKLPPNFMRETPHPTGVLRIRDEKLGPYPREEADVREHIAGYYAMITHLDAQIGRILDALEASGEADNTIIVFAGDNGLAVGQHALLGKQSVYEHSARVPLVICGPGIPRGRRCGALCYLHDVFPTICDLAGLEQPDSIQAKSVRPLLADQAGAVRDSVYLSFSEPARNNHAQDIFRGVRSGNWKLIKTAYGDYRGTQLFDLQADPWEVNNLTDDAACVDKLRELTELMRRWHKSSGDPLDPAMLGL